MKENSFVTSAIRKSSERIKTLHKVDCLPHQDGGKIMGLRHKNPTIVKFELNDSGRNK